MSDQRLPLIQALSGLLDQEEVIPDRTKEIIHEALVSRDGQAIDRALASIRLLPAEVRDRLLAQATRQSAEEENLWQWLEEVVKSPSHTPPDETRH
ncbi:hypothetical protein [Sulfuritalea sp.]|uniref:hypothetical protein n=1 Tax=Sulfuritalea sp. TaxID=2480090 RepID=UPI00286E91F8|nr:hypothetical protein [Sulfuritalea sp.]